MSITLLHASDLSEHHFGMCERAVDLARKLHANLYFLHVVETPATMVLAQGLGFTEIENPAPLLEDAKSVMEILGETFGIPNTQLLVELGTPKERILNKAAELGCQIIILGHDSKQTMLGSTVGTITAEAKCDVLILKI